MIFLAQAVGAQSGFGPADSAGGAASSVMGGGDPSQDPPSAPRPFDESDIDFSSWGAAASGEGSPRPLGSSSSVGLGAYVRMVVVLAAIVAVILLLFRFLKQAAAVQGGGDGQDADDTFLRRVSGIPLGANKSVQIVTLVDRAYLLGVGDSSVSLLAEIEDKELVDAMNLWSDKHSRSSKPRSFADVLDLFMPHGGRAEGRAASSGQDAGLFSSSGSQELLDSLRLQSRRLGGDGL